ncbi:MAG: hypothetical protein ACXWUG_11170 [Polyangiales bacterium]
MNKPGTRAIVVALFGSIAIVSTGCTVTTSTQPVDAYVYTEPVPTNVYTTYPTTVYEGRTYVWYHDRWIYQHHDHWAYVHDEPSELRRRRPYVQSAPPSYHHGYEHGGPPPPLPAPR